MAMAVAAPAVFAASAFAEGGIDDRARLWGQVNNVTPYEWTLAGYSKGLRTDVNSNCFPNPSCWDEQPFPQTVLPGQFFVYTLRPFQRESGGAFGGEKDSYDGWVTYRADVLGGPPEYLTITIDGFRCVGTGQICGLYVRGWNFTAPLDPALDPLSSGGPGIPPKTANPQISWTQANPYSSDFTFQIQGNWSVDASTTPPALVNILNSMCDDAQGTTCSFTQTAPLAWGIGKPQKQHDSANCMSTPPAGSVAKAQEGDDPNAPPDIDPNWSEKSYEVSSSASLSIGGSLSASTEANLFGVISSEITVELEAKHEWEEEKSFKRTTRIYIPSNNVGTIWLAPTVGTVKGTVVVSNKVATYTITNFTETRSGVTRDASTPAFHSITRVLPMTLAQWQDRCKKASSAKAAAAKRVEPDEPSAPTARAAAAGQTGRDAAPTGLVPGRGVTTVLLGHTESQVAARLGKPLFKSETAVDCPAVDPNCKAAGVERGTWVYPRVSLVFGANKRVTGIVYTGRRVTARRAGVGTTFQAFRKAHPRARCAKYLAFTNCRLTHKHDGRTAKTVFHFIHKDRGRQRECDRVMIYTRARGGQEATT
jgi:hypothetical protein